MNKRKYLLLFISLLIAIFSVYTNVYAEDEKIYSLVIEDDANLLKEEEKQLLEEEIKPLTEYGHVIFKTISVNDKETGTYTEDYYHDKYQEESGTIFLIDMQNRYIYLFSEGANSNKLTEEVEQKIVDEVASLATGGNYYSVVSTVFKRVKANLEGENIEETENDNKIVIEDDANLLTAEEIDKLKEKMKPLTQYGHIAFKSISENSMSAESYASQYYHEKFGTESGTLFLIDMANRKIYIFSDGTNYNVITRGKAEIITDNIYMYASRKEYYDCAYRAFDQMETILAGGKILEPMRYISNIVLSIVVAFFSTFIFVVQHTKIKKADDNKVLQNCNINVAASNITGRKTGTHRVYSPPSSSSSGGSSGGGGGGGGGGGSSGGGGGHSF